MLLSLRGSLYEERNHVMARGPNTEYSGETLARKKGGDPGYDEWVGWERQGIKP